MIAEEFGSTAEYLQAAGNAAVRAVERELRDLATRVAKVRWRHRPVERDGVNVCTECDGLRVQINRAAAPVLYPCSTIRDLDGDTSSETKRDAA